MGDLNQMTKIKEGLHKIWFNVWQIPGWLGILKLSKDYDEEDILYLERIDEEAIAYERDAEKAFYTYGKAAFLEKLKEFKEEVQKECGEDFIEERRLEFLDNQIQACSKRIDWIWREEEDAEKKDLPFWFRKALLEIKKPEVLERKRRGLVVEKFLLEHPDTKIPGRVSGEEIAQALLFPFENLIQVNKRGFALCPFHEEKTPSFYVKNNWGYCFGCGRNFDTIHLLMERDSLSFPKAVRALQ